MVAAFESESASESETETEAESEADAQTDSIHVSRDTACRWRIRQPKRAAAIARTATPLHECARRSQALRVLLSLKMALIVIGKTPCVLCGQALQRGEDLTGFLHIFLNRKSPLYRFSDAGVHRACLDADPHGRLAKRLSDLRLERLWENGRPHHRCTVCGERIEKLEENFSVGLNFEDPDDPAFEFNFLEFRKPHFPLWDRLEEFWRRVDRLQSSADWDGPRIAIVPEPHWKRRQ